MYSESRITKIETPLDVLHELFKHQFTEKWDNSLSHSQTQKTV